MTDTKQIKSAMFTLVSGANGRGILNNRQSFFKNLWNMHRAEYITCPLEALQPMMME